MYNAYPSVASTSLSASGTIAEEYVPLWVYSSGTASTTSTSQNCIPKGGTALVGSGASSAVLHTLNSSWNANQKFALEASVYSSSSSCTIAFGLYDITGHSLIGVTVTTATTATLIRSSAFTLVPGKQYGVTIYVYSGSGTAYLTKAHLVALEM